MAKVTELVDADYYAKPNDHVVLLIDPSQLKEKHKEFVKADYGRGIKGSAYCMMFGEWLIHKGYAREPTDEEFESLSEVHDY